METKIVTSVTQSKKLIELGIDVNTADMRYEEIPGIQDEYKLVFLKPNNKWEILAWSLSALLDILPLPQLSKDKLGSGKVGWMVSVYPDNCRYDSRWHDNPIDAAFEMVCYLLKNKLI